jgi:hypothetical protein
MSGCPKCDAPRVPHTEFCLDCGHDGEIGQPRLRRRLDITEIELSRRDRLVELLATLTEESTETAGWLLDRVRFEIDIDVTKAQGAWLEAMLAAAGLGFRSSDQAFSSASHRLRWAGGRDVGARLAITVAMGGAALAFGVPLVPIAAVVTSLVVAARAVRLVPDRLTIARSVVDRSLAVVDPAALAAARAARAVMSDPGAILRLRSCVDHVAEITWVVRTGGAHLLQPELGRLDDQIHLLLRQTSKLAVSVDRLRAPADDSATAEQRSKLDETRSEIERSLDEIERSLAATRNDVRELHGAEARGQALAAERRVLRELRIGIETALEMAELAAQLRGSKS